MEIFILALKLLIALPILLGLIILTFKLSQGQINNMQSKKYIKVLERTQISKDSFILVVKVGEKGAVLSSSKDKVEKIQDLTKEEVKAIEAKQEEEKAAMTQRYNDIIDNVKTLLKKVRVKGR